ncbi:hypothetical protein BV22DRAFT_1199776 [Leucogyrophana mollusca]|uniref:Uncharacterized protein n=1 Tax=Leucogyrophana mollusca TaxID=85980 RepID=A0ACB8B108_9AGAM|nr:hypothetical protein BV22DRAFT_1199776 [Leucogyrophana mollusca]
MAIVYQYWKHGMETAILEHFDPIHAASVDDDAQLHAGWDGTWVAALRFLTRAVARHLRRRFPHHLPDVKLNRLGDKSTLVRSPPPCASDRARNFGATSARASHPCTRHSSRSSRWRQGKVNVLGGGDMSSTLSSLIGANSVPAIKGEREKQGLQENVNPELLSQKSVVEHKGGIPALDASDFNANPPPLLQLSAASTSSTPSRRENRSP